MNLNDAKVKIQSYLNSSKTWPLIVDVQTKQDLANIIDYFKIGDNKFPSLEQFCNQDSLIKLDELYAFISNNSGNTFISCLTGFLMLLGEKKTKNALKTIITTSISDHVVVLTYQCKNYLKFSDPRILESGRLIIVDGTPDNVTEICFISPELLVAFPGSYQGINKVGYIIETCSNESTYIATATEKNAFEESIYHISYLNNSYDILRDKDSRTSVVPQSFGTSSQWDDVLQHMGSSGNWDTIIDEHFGSINNLSHAMSAYSLFDKQKKWLFFISLSICGAIDNEYLQLAVNNASDASEFVKSIYRAILTIDIHNPKFHSLYVQRKEIISNLKDSLSETMDFCKVLSVKGQDAIYYLTDLSQPEKERVITWLDTYGEKYSMEQLIGILDTVYPDLASYLSPYRFKDEFLNSYFEKYKYQKVINRILPSFEAIVEDQAIKMDFVSILRPRASIVEKLDANNSKAYFLDALGVEYLGFIQKKCNEYNLSSNISCARCELPSITEFNKDFVKTLSLKGCSVSDIKSLDDIKHHGEDNFDYEKEKKPIYLIRELEIIDELLVKIRANILSGKYEKAIILSDHGASRLAVLHNTENNLTMATKGEHSGRCCRVSEINSKPDYAIEESGFWVLANYERFQGGRKANVEVHGGSSLEEVTVPIIEITQRQTDIEAFIVDDSKIITLGAKEHAIIRIYVGAKSNNISIKLDNHYYDALASDEAYIYTVDLPDYTKKGCYTFDILKGNDVISIGQQFEIKKKGMSEVNLFG